MVDGTPPVFPFALTPTVTPFTTAVTPFPPFEGLPHTVKVMGFPVVL